MKKNFAIILSAGVGERSGLAIPKQFYKIAGKSILEHSIYAFEQHPDITDIIVVYHPDYEEKTKQILTQAAFKKIFKTLAGGKTRQESSYLALQVMEEEKANVLIHDSVRPFLTRDIIDACLLALETYASVDVAIPLGDTLIKVKDNRTIDSIPHRKDFMRGQTPQGFHLELIKKVNKKALEEQRTDFTDDCSLVLAYSDAPTYIVQGSEFNRKITTPVDVALCDKLFQLKTIPISNSLLSLEHKVVVVFGASKGIGKSVSTLAKQKQAIVYEFSRSHGVDITDFPKILQVLKEVFEKEGRIDTLIVTAGVLNVAPLSEREMTDITQEIHMNFLSIIHLMKSAYPYLKASQGSLVLFASSSYTRGRAGYSTYSSIKAAIVNLVQAVSEEWYEDHIRVNVISPERTDTFMRTSNFGKENLNTLLDPDFVAEKTLLTAFANFTGQVVDIKVFDNKRMEG